MFYSWRGPCLVSANTASTSHSRPSHRVHDMLISRLRFLYYYHICECNGYQVYVIGETELNIFKPRVCRIDTVNATGYLD